MSLAILTRLERKIDHVLFRLDVLMEEVLVMSVELDRLEAQVHQNTDAENSAVLLLNGLADMLKAARQDPQKLAQLETDLRTSKDRLAASILANTQPPAQPAQPAP